MTFNEAATVERMVLDTVTRRRTPAIPIIGEPPLDYPGSLGPDLRPARWEYVPAQEIPRLPGDVMVEARLRVVSPGEHGVPRRTRAKGDGADVVKGSQKRSQKSSQKILEAVRRDPDVTIADLAREGGITDRAIKKQIEKLKEQGRLRRIGPDRGGHWEIPE